MPVVQRLGGGAVELVNVLGQGDLGGFVAVHHCEGDGVVSACHVARELAQVDAGRVRAEASQGLEMGVDTGAALPEGDLVAGREHVQPRDVAGVLGDVAGHDDGVIGVVDHLLEEGARPAAGQQGGAGDDVTELAAEDLRDDVLEVDAAGAHPPAELVDARHLLRARAQALAPLEYCA